MIISKVNGNLISLALEGRYWGIAHGCNAQNVMKSGIAPKLCTMWPQMREADLATEKGGHGKLGSYSSARDTRLDMRLFNLYTQFHWNGRQRGERDLDYEAISNCFRKLDNHYGLEQNQSGKLLGIPMIGAGLAGGHWEAIQTIIDLSTPSLLIEVVSLQ